MTRKRTAPSPLADDRAAVSDVLGALMMVGITVIAAAGFGLLLFSFKGPADTQHSRLTASVTAGAGDWGDGDELLRLTHVGGETLDRSKVVIVFTTASGTTTLSGASLGSAFSDGKLTIGETWNRTITADVGDVVDVRIVVTGEQSQLLTSSSIVAGASATSLCLGDTTPPTASWTQSPSDLTGTSSGAVTVTATIRDLCSDVLDTPKPHLFYCIATSCVVPTSYTDAGEMTQIGAPGTHQWSKNIPHSGSWLADAVAGRSLNYYVSPVSDDVPNSGATAVRTDPVDLAATYTYVVSTSAVTGSVANLTKAQTAANGDVATLAEGAVTGSAGTGGPTKFSGASAATGGALNQNNVLASDDSRAEMDTTNDYIEATGIDLPANAATITSLTIGYEGRKSASAGTNPTTRLDYKVGSGAYSLGTSITESATTDTDRTRSLCATQAACTSGSFTVANVEAMTVRVFHVTDTNRNPQIDHVFVTVSYITAAQTNYRMDIELEWSGLPTATYHNVELVYRAETDTFNAYPWDYSTSNWRATPCTGTLSSATLVSYICTLTANEVSGGEARLRITDVTTSGLTQGKLYLDHARVASAS